MRPMNRASVVLLSLGAALAACSSGSEGVEAAPVVADGGKATTATAEEACRHEFRVRVERCAKDVAPQEIGGLRTRYVASCVAELGLAGTTRTAADVETCASALEARACGTEPAFLPECALKPGTLGVGASCNVDAQCQEGVCLVDASGTSCGRCVAPLADGDSCSQGSSFCRPGSACLGSIDAPVPTTCKRLSYADAGGECGGGTYCRPGYVCGKAPGAPAKCIPRYAPGERCADEACREDSFCDRVAGKCTSRGKDGEACDSQRPCAEGLGCDRTQHKCAPLTFVGAGESCGGSVACAQGVCGQGTGEPTCPQVVEDGDGCSEGGHMTCRAPAICLGGTCAMLTTLDCK